MLRPMHAILHAFDFESGSAYLSETELALEERQTKSYVSRHLRKISSSNESRRASFSQDSSFAAQLMDYLEGQTGFIPLSLQIAQWFWEELRRADSVEQCDLLIAEFSETVDIDAASDDEQLASSFDGNARQSLAILVLPRKLSFAHELDASGNNIYRHDSTLPSPTQKVVSYLIIDEDSLAIEYSDKPRLIAGQEVNVIADDFLHCSSQPSKKEVFEAVSNIVQEISTEAGLSASLEVSRAKAALAKAAEQDDEISPRELGRELFSEREDLIERYEQAAASQELPKKLPVKASAARRMAKTHRIRTDTGVEISFPSELAEQEGFIDFVRDESGKYTITIAQVSHIENR